MSYLKTSKQFIFSSKGYKNNKVKTSFSLFACKEEVGVGENGRMLLPEWNTETTQIGFL